MSDDTRDRDETMNDDAKNDDTRSGTSGGTARDAEPGTPLAAARERFTRVAEELRGRYERATGGLQDKAKQARRELRDSARKAREHYDDAGERLRESYGRASDRAGEWGDDLEGFVQQHPGRAVLIAAGVGFLLGLLFRRRD